MLLADLTYMKTHTIIALTICSILFGAYSVHADMDSNKCEAIYQQWHQVLKKYPHLDIPSWFDTDYEKDLAQAVQLIDSNKLAMAFYLCEKLAARTNFNSGHMTAKDIDLLRRVSGISFSQDKDDHGEYFPIGKYVELFGEQWRAGAYKDTSLIIRKICMSNTSSWTTNHSAISGLDSILHYGIFALPELVRQVKANNSKLAFSAYLIITHNYEQQGEYYYNSDRQFISKQSKLEHMKSQMELMALKAGKYYDILKKISDAFNDN